MKFGFCERKFGAMFLSRTFIMVTEYVMLLCDSVIAGRYLGEVGISAINAVTPVVGFISFLTGIIAIGSGIAYSREIGEMHERRADEIYGQGMIVIIGMAILSAVVLFFGKDLYFRASGIGEDIYGLAVEYYRLLPISAFLSVFLSYFGHMVYTDGDVILSNVSYTLQIGGNILFSIVLFRVYGMIGIIMGTIVGNVLGILPIILHFFKKSNTLHFVWHFSWKDFVHVVSLSVSDSVVFLCLAVADYVVIRHISAHYGAIEHVTLAIVFNLIQLNMILGGVGMAIQPLLGTYLGENNYLMIRRLMNSAIKASFAEGVIVNVLVFIFAKQFCAQFGIYSAEVLEVSVRAVRIVSLGLVFCGFISLMAAYYPQALATSIIVIKDGFLYSILPVLGSLSFGKDGMWSGYIIAPVITFAAALLYVLFRYGKKKFPYILDEVDPDIVVMDEELIPKNCALLSQRVEEELLSRGYARSAVTMAAVFIEEIGLTVIEKNAASKRHRKLFVEISMIFDARSVLLIERDSGMVFDITDPNLKIAGLSSFILSGLMETHKEKAYQTTTGYNRNMMRFYKDEKPEKGSAETAVSAE